MTTLTYEDLQNIRAALKERDGMAATLGRVERLLDERAYRPLTTLNAETIAALNEPREGLPVAHSVQELMRELHSDD